MNKSLKKATVITAAIVALVGFSALIVHNYKTKTSFKYESQTAEELKPQQNEQDVVNAAINANAQLEKSFTNSNLLKIEGSDYVLGSKDAPILMIEYASLSCPHCASFTRESFEKLKSDYIDTGKVRFVFRNFPLNQSALTAAMFAACQAQDNKPQSVEKYYSTLKALFKTQDSWAFDEKFAQKLEAIAKLDGMSSERFNSCINNKKLQEKILVDRMDAAKELQLKSTPSFFVNGEISEGYVDYQTLKKLIEKKLIEANK